MMTSSTWSQNAQSNPNTSPCYPLSKRSTNQNLQNCFPPIPFKSQSASWSFSKASKTKALHQSAIFLVCVIFHVLFTFSILLAVALLEKGHLNLCQHCWQGRFRANLVSLYITSDGYSNSRITWSPNLALSLTSPSTISHVYTLWIYLSKISHIWDIPVV